MLYKMEYVHVKILINLAVNVTTAFVHVYMLRVCIAILCMSV